MSSKLITILNKIYNKATVDKNIILCWISAVDDSAEISSDTSWKWDKDA